MAPMVAAFSPAAQQGTRGEKPAKLSQPRFETLNDAIYHVVHRSALPAKALADRCGCRYSYLVAAADAMQSQSLPARLVVPLTLAAGDDAIIRHLAEACGGVFVRIPVAPGGGHAAVVESVARIAAEFGELMHETGKALADGRITRAEADRARTEIRDVLEQLHAFDALLAEVQ